MIKMASVLIGSSMALLGCISTMVLWTRVEAYGWRDTFYKSLLLVNTVATAVAGAAMAWYSLRFQ